MASQFIGLTVFLILKDPEQTQLRGLVADVVVQELVLTNALFVKTGHVIPSFRVSGHNIQDIEIVNEDYLPPSSQPTLHVQQQQHTVVGHTSQGNRVQSITRGVPVQQRQYQNQLHEQKLQQHAQYYSAPQVHQQDVPPTLASVSSYAHSITHHNTQPTFIAPEFEDPAIVSMSRQSAAISASAPLCQIRPTPQPLAQPTFTLATPTRSPIDPAMSRNASMGLSQKASFQSSAVPVGNKAESIPCTPLLVSVVTENTASTRPELQRPTTSLQQSFSDMNLRRDAAESSTFYETDDATSSLVPPTPHNRRNVFSGKRSKRGNRGRHEVTNRQSDNFLEPTHQQREDSVVLQPGMFGGAIAQAATQAAGQRNTAKKKIKRRIRKENGHFTNAEEEGWATEDVNDYKERDFDFQGNLDRFDKKTVFSQIKAEDNTADEARLVSFNRLPRKPPTKKNYHHTENVLGSYINGQGKVGREGWNTPEFSAEMSEDTENESLRGRNVGAVDSGRSSRRAMSRQSISNRRIVRQSAGTLAAKHSVEVLSSGGSVVMNKSGKPSLRLSPSNRPCPIVSPLQMLDVERIAEVELGLTDDMMTENAGRGIAQVAIQAFGKRITASNHNAPPVLLVFAGNNKTGARAIAAGRHLKNHHVRVLVCVLGFEREEELLENVRRQLNIFRNAGGRVARWEEMQSNLKSLDSPVELIIDGLLGMHHGFEDLRTDDQATAFDMFQFANTNKASILSVDIPSGIDGGTGEIAQLEDTDAFYMRAKWVVCMGAPKSGLLHANLTGVGAGWSLYVADIGISNTAWRKYGTRRRHGVEFAADWVVNLTFYDSA